MGVGARQNRFCGGQNRVQDQGEGEDEDESEEDKRERGADSSCEDEAAWEEARHSLMQRAGAVVRPNRWVAGHHSATRGELG